jgi:hypothetical protein
MSEQQETPAVVVQAGLASAAGSAPEPEIKPAPESGTEDGEG